MRLIPPAFSIAGGMSCRDAINRVSLVGLVPHICLLLADVGLFEKFLPSVPFRNRLCPPALTGPQPISIAHVCTVASACRVARRTAYLAWKWILRGDAFAR